MKPFLILQLRPETEASDNEYTAFLEKGGLDAARTVRVRLDREPLPAGFDLDDHAAVIVGGGPPCVSDDPAAQSETDRRIEAAVLGLLPAITEADFPYLGCCYGIGVLAHHLGGTVNKDRYSEEVGPVDCNVTAAGQDDPLVRGAPDRFTAFTGHKEAVQALPPGCVHLIASEPCPFQMIRYKSNVYATQFHPEADCGVFELRIEIYKHRGYFPPEESERLIRNCRAADVTVPQKILRGFVERYGK